MFTVLDVKGDLLIARTYSLDENDQAVPYASFAINRGENIDSNQEGNTKGCKGDLTISSYSKFDLIYPSSFDLNESEKLKDEFITYQKKYAFDMYKDAKMAGAQDLEEVETKISS